MPPKINLNILLEDLIIFILYILRNMKIYKKAENLFRLSAFFIYYFAFSSTGFLNIPRSIAPTIVPITTDNRYINGFPITGNTNIPP